MDNGMMILNSGDKIYPNFSFKNLQELCKVDSFTDENFRKSLYLMNQTSREKEFFMAYQNKFLMKENSNVPLLIPQAWIQWHSQNKKDLRAIDLNSVGYIPRSLLRSVKTASERVLLSEAEPRSVRGVAK
jgi:hypothetical protein